jgi:hypothetical protein
LQKSFSSIDGTGSSAHPTRVIFFVGWAEEPVQFIFARGLIYSNSCRSRKFFTPPQPSPNSRSGSKKFTNDARIAISKGYNQNSPGRINTKETGFFTECAGCGASSRKKTRFLDPMGLILRKFCIES